MSFTFPYKIRTRPSMAEVVDKNHKRLEQEAPVCLLRTDLRLLHLSRPCLMLRRLEMNRSESEWALEQFLEEFSTSTSIPRTPIIFDKKVISSAATCSVALQSSTSKREEGDDGEVVEIERPDRDCESSRPPHLQPLDPKLMTGNKSDQHHHFLKNQLNLACAAVAITRASSSKPSNVVQQANCEEKHSKHSQSGSRTREEGGALRFSTTQGELIGTPIAIPALPAIPRNSGVQVGQTTSGSSRDESDEDDIEGDLENMGNMDPANAKRARRMLSNRESARRSRSRKQAHLTELEGQVGQLRVDYSGLLKRLTDINQKYDDAAVDNRILKADIETLRAKVKMAEETVKRVTGISPLLLAMANGPSMAMPFDSCQLGNAGLPLQSNTHFFHQTDPSFFSTSPHHQRLDGNSRNALVGVSQHEIVPNTMGDVSSIQNVPVSDHLPKQIHRHSGSGSGHLH